VRESRACTASKIREQRNILSIATVTALAVVLQIGNVMAQQRTLKEQLTGSWTLVSNDNVAPDGTKRQIFGPNPKGMLILAADGNYTQVQINPARPKFKGKTRLDALQKKIKRSSLAPQQPLGRGR